MAKRTQDGGTTVDDSGLALVPVPEMRTEIGDDVPPVPLDSGIDVQAFLREETGTTGGTVDPGPHYAANSEMTATPEEHAKAKANKKGGRPPNPVFEKDTTTYIPTPKFNSFKSDATNPAQRTKALWNWWNALHPAQKDQLQAYVYRDWPILKLPTGTRMEDVGANPSMDKISGSEPIQDDVDFLHRYGVGIYRLRLNKVTSRKDGTSGTITTAYINGLGLDMKSHPPTDKRVSDIDQVELTHPENGSYIAFLRMQGKLPEQRNQKDEDEKMATVTAVSEMTGLVGKLIDDRNKNTSESQVASTKAMEVVAEGAKAAIKITQDANEYAAKERERADEERRRQQAPATTPGPVADPLDQALRIVSLMKESRGNDDIMSKFMDQMQKQQERMEALFKEVMGKPQATPTPIQERVKDLAELKQMSETLWPHEKEDVTGDAITDAASEMGPKWLRPYMPILVPVLTGLAQAWMTPRPQGPMPVQMPQPQYQPPQYPPPTQFPGPQPLPMPPATAMPMTMTTNPGMAAAQVPSADQMPPQVLKLMQMIELPFLNHIINPTLTGTDFAGWFQDGMGVTAFDQVIAFGPDSLFQAIASYQPIAMELVRLNMPEKRVRDFVAEFCDPKWENEDRGEKKESTTADTLTTPPLTVV